MFWEKLGLEEACSLCDLLNKAHPYFRYKEELYMNKERITNKQETLYTIGLQKNTLIVIETMKTEDPGLNFLHTLL